MKYIFTTILSVLVLLAVTSCKKKAKVSAERPDVVTNVEAFVGEVSHINIPIELSIAELEKTANQVMSGVIYKDESYTNNDNDDLKLIVKKKSNISISAKGNNIYYNVPLNIWAKVRKRVLGVELAEDTDFDAILKFKTELNVNNNWDFKTKTSSLGYKILKKPVINLGPIEIPITGLVKDALDEQMDFITSTLDEEVQAQLNLKKIVQDNWRLMQKPVLLDKTYKTWLRVQPKEFTMSPIQGTKQHIKLNIGVNSIIDVFSGDEPTYSVNTILPPLVIEDNPKPDFHISLASEISYDQANKLLANSLVGFTYQHKKKEIEVTKANVYGNGDRLVMEVFVGGDVEGQLYFTGKPAYDSLSNTMFIDEFDMDVKSKKVVLKVANWLLKGTFKKRIERHLRVSLQEEVEGVTELIQKNLKENSVSDDLAIDLNIDRVVPRGVYVSDKTMRIILDISGKTSVKYGK